VLLHVPVVNVIGARPRNEAPDNPDRIIPGQIGRDHGPHRVHQGVQIHLAVEKPEERVDQERRPVPRQGKARCLAGRELAELLQITIGVGADKRAPELSLLQRKRGGFLLQWRREGRAALVTEAGIIGVWLLACFAGFHRVLL
jgi:hypothetical protein